jgi:hypothetical protein
VPEHGLVLIDNLLNLEKNMYMCLAQQSSACPQFDAAILSVERRSLNLMRRLCVVEFMPEFLELLEKLDSRLCYRWIEKSLEFFTKYALASTEVIAKQDDKFQLDYLNVKLLQVIYNDQYFSI